MKKSRLFQIRKIIADEVLDVEDCVAVEEPLQITVDGVPLAVVMRTVGDDEELVMGFLITEGIVGSTGDVMRVDTEQKKNHALVFLADDVQVDLGRLKRNLYSASSCGICGKASMDEVFSCLEGKRSLAENSLKVSRSDLAGFPDTLKQSQDVFEQTGGLHAAGLFDAGGNLLILREDVGRHNAIDKVVGAALLKGIELGQTVLQLSGRVSFEVVQKALMSGVPIVSAISAPTSLAVDFAKEGQMTLVGFMRGERMNVYSGAERLV